MNRRAIVSRPLRGLGPLEVTVCDHQIKTSQTAPLPLSLLSYFKPSIYDAPLRRESAQRTIENSPAIHRWDLVAISNQSPCSGRLKGTSHVALFC
jgi:hypothetical protein